MISCDSFKFHLYIIYDIILILGFSIDSNVKDQFVAQPLFLSVCLQVLYFSKTVEDRVGEN